MARYRNLVIVGTSHIAGQSVEEVKKTILSIRPAVVAIELDRRRLFSMLNKDAKKRLSLRDIRSIGFKGYLFSLFGEYFEKKLGQKTGFAPGDEMLTGYHLGREVGAKIALVDQDISITLRRFSEKLTWREKWRFLRDIFSSIFFARRQMRKYGISNIDLNKVPEEKIIRKLTGYLKENYPNVHLVLVEERNIILAKNLSHLMASHPDSEIVAILGAGHVGDVLKLIKENDKNNNKK